MSVEEEILLLKGNESFITFLRIGGILFILMSIVSFRVYLRSKLKAELVRSITGVSFAVFAIIFPYIPDQFVLPFFICLCIIGTSFIALPWFFSIFINGSEKYYALWKETTFLQKFTGNIPPISSGEAYRRVAKRMDIIGSVVSIIFFFLLTFLEMCGFRNFYTLIFRWILLFLGVSTLAKYLLFKKKN